MPSFQIAERIKQDVRNARVIGEFTVKIGVQKLPGLVWNAISTVRNSVYPESTPRVRPAATEAAVVDSKPNKAQITRQPEPCDGYDLLTGTQIVELLQSASASEAHGIFEYECTHRNRAVVLAAAQSVTAVQ